MAWKRKDLLGMQDLEAAEITDVLDTAESMWSNAKNNRGTR